MRHASATLAAPAAQWVSLIARSVVDGDAVACVQQPAHHSDAHPSESMKTTFVPIAPGLRI
jgi:hypothetical protein